MTKNIFFTSDLHFGHNNILKFGRGNTYTDINEHDSGIINNWNSVVNVKDEVYVLGDVSLYNDINFIRNKLTALNGHKHLIFGNHDKIKLHAQLKNEGIWESIQEYTEKSINFENKKYRLILSHFPILEFNHAFRPTALHLYGHVHDMTDYRPLYKQLGFKALHVGVDTSDLYPQTKKYTPINITDLIKYSIEYYK